MADIAMPAELMIVDTMPQLGAGKTDFMAVQRMVRERAAAAPASSATPEAPAEAAVA